MSYWDLFDRDSDDLPEEAITAMSAKAEIYLRSGGTVTMTDWEGMASAGHAAFLEANTRIEAERQSMTGYSAQNYSNFLESFSRVDGGKLRTEHLLMGAATAIATKRESKEIRV